MLGLLDKEGRARLLDMPDDDLATLDNYVGSVAVSACGTVVAATSPRGGTIAFWGRASGRYLGRRRGRDACGIAPVLTAAGGVRTFMVSSGNEGVRLVPVEAGHAERLSGQLSPVAWDNHLRAL